MSHIEIDVDKQRARFFDGQQEIGWTTVASGIRSFPTPTGRFVVMEKATEAKSNLYGKIYGKGGKLVKANAQMGVDTIPPGGRFEGADMPYFLRFTGDGIGLHAGPIPRPGSPASHGCIRMPMALAPILYSQVKIGTPVSIVGSGPTYAAYITQMQRKAAMIALAKAKRDAAKPAEGQSATAAPTAADASTLAKAQTEGVSSAADQPQPTPGSATTPVAAARTTTAPAPPAKADANPSTAAAAAATETTGASAPSTPLASPNRPPATKADTAAAATMTGNAPAKTPVSSTSSPPVAAEGRPAAAGPTAAKTSEHIQQPLAAPPGKAETAKGNDADKASTDPAKTKSDTSGPVTLKASEPTPQSPAPVPALAPAHAATGSTGGQAPATPKAPVDSAQTTRRPTPENEG